MKQILFVCNHNAGRSQMAEALFERHAPPDLRANSAGSDPAAAVWPTVVEVMAEIGIDVSARRPRKLTVEMQLQADWAITMGCGDACPFVPARVEEWDLPDPAHESIEVVRAIRDEIERRVRALIEERAGEIRQDSTAHGLRLSRLLPSLIEEFGDSRTPEEIRICADAILHDFDEAPVRGFVMAIASRRARDCLSAEHCYELDREPDLKLVP